MGDDNIRRILEGKTKKNQLAYQQIAKWMNSEHNFPCTKTQVISKIKYLKGQYTREYTQAKNKDRSGASRDDMIRCCPYFDEHKPILDHGIAANDLSPESPGMMSLVSSVSGIPPAFASIEKRLPTASSGKFFHGIKSFRYGRSNRKTLLVC